MNPFSIYSYHKKNLLNAFYNETFLIHSCSFSMHSYSKPFSSAFLLEKPFQYIPVVKSFTINAIRCDRQAITLSLIILAFFADCNFLSRLPDKTYLNNILNFVDSSLFPFYNLFIRNPRPLMYNVTIVLICCFEDLKVSNLHGGKFDF